MQGLIGRAYRVFWRNDRGASAMIFALFLPVLMLLIGGAIDFSRLLQLRMELQDACDAASVGAVGVDSAAFQAGIAMSGNGTIAAGSTQAQAIFNSDMPTNSDLTGTVFTAAVSKTNTVITSVISLKSNYKSTILGLFVPALSSIPITIASTSSATVPPYINFYLLLDNTPSMGLGATTSDINALVTATAHETGTLASDENCAFACHETDLPGADYYALAKSLGITMRIDVVRQATQNLMTTATNTETLPNQFGMAIYDFGTDASVIGTTPNAYLVSALSTNLTTTSSNAASIDLMTIPYQNYNSDEQTNYTSVLANMNTIIPSNGSGMTAASPEEVLFMVADGMQDSHNTAYNNGGTAGRRITPIDTTTCTTLKNRGVRIAVLYTTYLVIPKGEDSWVDTYVTPLLSPTDTVATAMQSCASPGLYFAVSPSQGISDAMTALFQKVVSVVRINS
jgi:Flp pilus assembly protein TadG